MKNIISFLFFALLPLASFAELKIFFDATTVENTINSQIPSENRELSAMVYESEMDADGLITVPGLYKVCSAAGFDVKTSTGYNNCEKFVFTLTESLKSTLPYFEVCGDDENKSGGIEYCVKGFFNWTNVGMLQAVGLAKEYARVINGHTIECSDDYDTRWNDNYVKCTSVDKKYFYEFQFDDVREKLDLTIQNNLRKAICKIHNKEPYHTDRGCIGACTESLTKTANALAYKTQDFKGNCLLNMAGGIWKEDLEERLKKNSIEGIDNYIFYAGIQIQGSESTIDALKQYIQNTGYNVNSFYCDNNVTRIYQDSLIDDSDDLLHCYLNGDPIDFVFDDFSEMSKTYDRGGKQAIDCKIVGGTYTGKKCMHISEQVCKEIAAKNLENCPECKSIYWGPDVDGNMACLLPSSKSATTLAKGINIGVMVGAATGAVVLTVATGGAAMAVVGGAAGTAIMSSATVLVLVETAGAVIEITAQAKINKIADEFFAESGNCYEPECAQSLLSKYLQRLANLSGDFDDASFDAIDDEFARMAAMLPPGFYEKITLAENQLGFFDADSWEPEQVWRAVGIGLQITGVFTAISKFLFGKSAKFIKTTKTLTDGIKKSSSVVAHSKNISQIRPVEDLKKLIMGDLDEHIAHLKKNPYQVQFSHEKSLMSDDEWNALNEAIKKDGFKFEDVGNGMWLTRSAAVDDMETLLNKASKNWMDYYAEAVDNGTSLHKIPNSSLTENEWDVLNRHLAEHDMQLIDSGDGYKVFKKAQYAEVVDNYTLLKRKISGDFDASVKRFLNTGKSDGFNSSLLKNDEWTQINEELKKDNIGLFLSSDGNMYFDKLNQSDSAIKNNSRRGLFTKLKEFFANKNNITDAVRATGSETGKMSEEAAEYYAKMMSHFTGMQAEVTRKNGKFLLKFNISGINEEQFFKFNDGLMQGGLKSFGENAADGNYFVYLDLEGAAYNSTSTSKSNPMFFDNDYQISDDLKTPLTEEKEQEYAQFLLEDLTDEISGSNGERVVQQRLHDMGAWDLNKAIGMATDMRLSLIKNLKSNQQISDAIGNWDNLSLEDRKELVGHLHYIVKNERVAPTANNLLSFNDGFIGRENSLGVKAGISEDIDWIRYDNDYIKDSSFDEMLSLIVHENYHSFQTAGKSTVSKEYIDLAYKYYNSKSSNRNIYSNSAIEVESRFFQHEISDNFQSNFKSTSSSNGNNATGVRQTSNKVDDSASSANSAAKAEKIKQAEKSGDLGYHGTDANIDMYNDFIRPSANSNDALGGAQSAGFGIAQSYDAAEVYAIRRLVEVQNPGVGISFVKEGDVLVIRSQKKLNLTNKECFVYTTAKDSSQEWHGLRNSSAGNFNAARMPNEVEILDKKALNIDDFVRSGKVKFVY